LPLRALHAAGVVDIGPGLQVGRGVDLDLYGDLVIGKAVVLQDHCQLRVGVGATLTLGDGVLIGRGTVISAAESVVIGAHTLIAEHCTVRDSNHALDPDDRRADISTLAPVRIGERVWLGSGVRVLQGATVGDGTGVGANSVVTRALPANVLAVGAPARVLRPLK
jgi:maltose O-acetyltransferase